MARKSLRLVCLLLSVVVSLMGCHKKPEKRKSSKQQREEAIQKASDEQAALNKFAGSVREILVWYQAQPVVSEAGRQQVVKELAQKMEQVSVKELPDELSRSWGHMLKAWQALAKTPAPGAALREQGARAAEDINRRLAAHGVTGIRF